jgi:hypothetical protein
MPRFTAASLALATILLAAGATSTTALALPTILNSLGELAGVIKYTDHSEEIQPFEKLNGKLFRCQSSESEGEFTKNSLLGPFHVTMERCNGEFGCTGTGDANGVVLWLGTAHLVYDSLTTLGVAMLYLLAPTRLTCASIPIEAKGELLCLIAPINSLVLGQRVVCEETSSDSGDPKEGIYWNDKGEPINIKEGLLLNEGSGAFEMAAASWEDSIGYSKERYSIMG